MPSLKNQVEEASIIENMMPAYPEEGHARLIMGLFLLGLLQLGAGLSRAKVASNKHLDCTCLKPKNRYVSPRAGQGGGFSEGDACVCESEYSLK